MTLEEIKQFVEFAELSAKVIDSGADWEDIYNFIYETYANTPDWIRPDFEWCLAYPSEFSYQQNAKDLNMAIQEKAESLKKILAALTE